jgi:hypothetical protein
MLTFKKINASEILDSSQFTNFSRLQHFGQQIILKMKTLYL